MKPNHSKWWWKGQLFTVSAWTDEITLKTNCKRLTLTNNHLSEVQGPMPFHKFSSSIKQKNNINLSTHLQTSTVLKLKTKNKGTPWASSTKCKLTDARGDKTFSWAGFESLRVFVSRLGHRHHTHFVRGRWFQVIQGQPEVISGAITISVPVMLTCQGKWSGDKLISSDFQRSRSLQCALLNRMWLQWSGPSLSLSLSLSLCLSLSLSPYTYI